MRTRSLPALAAVLVLALAGCGAEKSTGSGSGGGSPDEPTSATGGDTVRVKIKDIAFLPDKITARVGQTIRWTNKDSIVHTVVAKKGADFRSERLQSGDTFEAKLTKAGTIGYVCTIHPNQKGTISVTK